MARNPPKLVEPRRRRWLFGVAGLGLLAYVAIIAVYAALQSGPGLRQFDATAVAAALLLSLLSFGLRFWRWAGLMAALGHRPPVGRHFLAYLSGFALTTTPGKAGEALRGFYLRRHGVPLVDSVAAFIAERLMDVMALCLLGALLVARQPQLALAAAVLAGLCIAGGLLVTHRRFASALETWCQRREGSLATLGGKLAGLLASSGALLNPRRLLAGVGLGTLAWSLQGLGLYGLGRSAGIDWVPALALGIYAAGLLASLLVFFMPGGLGGTELAMVGLLKMIGVGTAVALPLTLVSQLVNLWFAVLVGLLAVALLSLLPTPSPSPPPPLTP